MRDQLAIAHALAVSGGQISAEPVRTPRRSEHRHLRNNALPTAQRPRIGGKATARSPGSAISPRLRTRGDIGLRSDENGLGSFRSGGFETQHVDPGSQHDAPATKPLHCEPTLVTTAFRRSRSCIDIRGNRAEKLVERFRRELREGS